MKRYPSLTLGVLLACVTLRAQTPATPQTSPPRRTRSSDVMQRPEVQRGQKLFTQSCSFCHGASAEGGAEGPSLVLSSVVRHDKNGDLIGEVIREGRPGKGMPSFPFDGSQIADLVTFLHARVTISDVRSAGKNGSYSLKQLLTGNAAAGKQFFDGPGGCSGCHSPTGDLAGIANRYQPVELQALFLYPADTAHETVKVVLPSGKTVEGALAQLDAFTVALKDAGGWYHSWPIGSVKVTVHDPLAVHRKLLYKYTNTDMHNLFAYLETLK
ncbi:MAG TPA: c-type cytochrome [Bryobacteraceae bacterium]|nr:c-type cytochrome [Bryobacteraceae bacterium]